MKLREAEGIFRELKRLETKLFELKEYRQEAIAFCDQQSKNLVWQVEYLRTALREMLQVEDRQSVKTPYGNANRMHSRRYTYEDRKVLNWAKRKDLLEEVSERRLVRGKVRELMAEGVKIPGVTVEMEEGISVSLRSSDTKDVKEGSAKTTSSAKSDDGWALWGKISSEEED